MTWSLHWRPDDTTLRALGLDLRDVVSIERVDGGLSGAHLSRVRLASPAGPWGEAPRWRGARMVKEQHALGGWIAQATHDDHVREVTLFQSGLAQRIPRRIGLAVERWSLVPSEMETNTTYGALLMRDVRNRLMRDPYRAPRGHLPESVRSVLAALAEMHARFWGSPALDEPDLGLVSLRDTLLWLAPPAIEEALASGLNDPYLYLAQRGWKAFFRLISPDDAATLSATVASPERALAAIGRLPRTLTHGDVWGPNMGRFPPTRHPPRAGSQTLLIDWALVAVAPGLWDPLTMLGAWHSLSPVTLLSAYRAHLTPRLKARGIALLPATWRLLVASAWLRGTLGFGEAYARAVEEAPGALAHQRALARLRWWASRGARAARLLEEIS
ncbi:MAG TPA: hypothetical protein VF808_02595 [Ktedonobacterales bacterium]